MVTKFFLIGPDDRPKGIHWRNLRCQQAVLDAGNYYRTIGEANKAAATIRFRKKYRSLGRAFDPQRANWHAVYDPRKKEIVVCAIDFAPEGVCFDSEEECRAAIKAIGGKEVFVAYILENDEHKRL